MRRLLMHRLDGRTITVALASAVLMTHGAFAQEASNLSGAPVRKMTMESGPTAGKTQTLSLTVNRTYMVELDTDVDDIIVASPDIVSISAQSRRQVAIMGLKPGASNVVFLDGSGRKLLNLDVSVTNGVAGVAELQDLIKRYVPGSKVQVENVNGRIILAGSVQNAQSADRAVTLAAQFVDKPDQVLNLMTILGKDQVALKVRIVEMQRTMVKQLGINLSGSVGFGELNGTEWQNLFEGSTNNSFNIAGSALGGLSASVGSVNMVGGAVQSSVAAGLNALERVGLLRTLAEPNLTALSGESAKFLAGGEYPIPVAQDQGKIGIQFKPYGVGLGFTPVVLSEGRISLQVSTEVSELSPIGSYQSTGVSGVDPTTGVAIVTSSISVPALKVRRAETTVELPSGGSLVIAGLIQQQTKQSLEGVPGVKDTPILGALFRSRDFQNDETELVVIVTPYLVDPTDPQKLRTPDEGYVTARDAETVFFGKLNEIYKVPGSNAGTTTAPKGSGGFILD
ncbi:MAG: type II and III secretion system protein family protein [Hyphomonadaceae bacterium]